MLNFEFQGNRKLRDEVTSSRLNAILTELRRIRPVAGRGINVQQEPNGTRISALDSFVSGSGGGAATAPQPWDLISRRDPESDPENPSYLVTVRPGTVNSVLPSNWQTEGEAKDVQCNNSDLYYGKAVIATDGTDITGVTVALDTSPPEFQQATASGFAESVEYLFGLFYEGVAYRLAPPGQIKLDSSLWMITDKESPSPGASPYIFHYLLR
jgi:hypothetical protein